MRTKFQYLILMPLLLAACTEPDSLEEKKGQLKAFKTEANELEEKIKELETAIAREDEGFAQVNKRATLITTTPVEVVNFEHFVDVSGFIASRQNILITAEVAGAVERIPVNEGANVRKGQLLLAMDAEPVRRNIQELQTSLELATTVFERQSNLWEQKIGTEIQYLETRNSKESIERRLATANTQLAKYVIRAPFDGTIEEVMINVGEAAMPGVQLIRVVGSQNMYLSADVSESFAGQFHQGDSVLVELPSTGVTFSTVISAVGQVINQENRTFTVEVQLPAHIKEAMPNQLAVIKIKDFGKKEAVVIPTNLIQNDNKGEYVFIVNQNDGNPIAQKIHIERGRTYQGQTVVTSGLTGNEMLVDKGFREVAEGANVKQAQATL